VEAYALFRDTIEKIMRQNGQVHLSDMYKKLLSYISEEIVPQVFYYLGDSIFHYLIDEFQDTAPVQWEAIKPLLSEALSKQGSLFIVGDTKQSIYGFRSADWRIMKSLMDTTVFPSAPAEVGDLANNYRSGGRILEFSKTVFHSIVPKVITGEASSASGLSTFKQEVVEKNRKKGYVEVVSFEHDGELEQARVKILDIVRTCHTRGYRYGDITILTSKNEHVVAISAWLNGSSVDFISHSSLDIRGRALTNEIIALLRFLDSPIDDLSFTTVLLSSMFQRILAADHVAMTVEAIHSFLLRERREAHAAPLYTLFRRHYPDIWRKYFDELFTVVGYLPMYDLLSELYKQFRLFEIAPEEEGTLAKLLEVMKNFEERGQNSLKDFLAVTESEADEGDWNINVPQGTDAVSVMTIHKAKGLDSRVVIVLLVDTKPRPENLFFEHTDEGVRLVRITQKNSEYSTVLQQLYHQRTIDRTVDNLNKLYVAFTRAKEEMYIVSVKSDYADEPSKFLPASGFEPSTKPNVEPQKEIREAVVPKYYSSVRRPVSTTAPEKLALYERRRGDAVHEVLSLVEFADADVETLVASSLHNIAGNWMQPADEEHMKSVLVEFLKMPEVAPFFRRVDERKIKNEQEFVSPDGRLFRMDRVVIDSDTVTVLDFKTGDDKEGYTEQVQGYVSLLRNFYPDRTVQGVLAFVDRKRIRVVV
jgi:ATP-dependent helicase/nuclease subunit A